MQSSEKLAPLTRAQANERLAELYVTYVLQTAEAGFIERQFAALRNHNDIQQTFMELGKAMQMQERGLAFSFEVAGKKMALAHAGSQTLEKFYFHQKDIDKIIEHSHLSQNQADQMNAECKIAQARLQADTRAFRSICNLDDFKVAAAPVVECLFAKTGPQIGYIDPATLPPEDIGAPAGPVGMD